MKKLPVVLLSLCLLAVLAVSCAKDESSATNLTGATDAILVQITEGAAALVEENRIPVTFTDGITKDNSQSILYVSADDFEANVEDAYAESALMSVAHRVALIKCKDAASAKKISDLIAGNFNSGWMICVTPDSSWTLVSGQYVLLVVSKDDYADAALQSFEELAGKDNVKSEKFYTIGDALPEGDGGGLLLG
ncbi:MAG: hypothetical protein LBS90_07060 [Oscillospiraceae bacterium]|nr:hypothetical protein [Oscillospiraceae bacterium]